MEITEGEESEQGIKNIFEEIMMENFPNLLKEKTHKSRKEQSIPNRMVPKRPTPRHIIIMQSLVTRRES